LDAVRASLNPVPERFAAHVAFYPAGVVGAIAQPGAYTGAPVLMLLGQKDDDLPVLKMENYLAYARESGAPAPIEMVVYPGAYHAWTVPDLPPPRFYPDLVSTKKCPLILLGPRQTALLMGGTASAFDPAAFTACVAAAPGYSMGFNAAVRAQSIDDALHFLRSKLQP
jgi:dienelactone hydrolase